MNLNKGSVVVSGFPGIGKSYLCKIGGDKIEDVSHIRFNSEFFPEFYVDHIMSLLGKREIILISSHRDVLIELERVGIDYILVHPSRKSKNEYINRYKSMNLSSQFINTFDSKWESYLRDIESACPSKRIVLKSGEYLKDRLNSLYL